MTVLDALLVVAVLLAGLVAIGIWLPQEPTVAEHMARIAAAFEDMRREVLEQLTALDDLAVAIERFAEKWDIE